MKQWWERPTSPKVEPGDIVLDVGCRLTRHRRAEGLEPPPKRVRVVEVMGHRWLRIASLSDPEDQWDCEDWEVPCP